MPNPSIRPQIIITLLVFAAVIVLILTHAPGLIYALGAVLGIVSAVLAWREGAPPLKVLLRVIAAMLSLSLTGLGGRVPPLIGILILWLLSSSFYIPPKRLARLREKIAEIQARHR